MDFTIEQEAILADDCSSIKILAGAGSGKTTTMAHYVKKQITSGRTREEAICFITFTRFAAEEIKKKVRTILGRHTYILTGTFHATMFKLLKQAGLKQHEGEFLYDNCMEESVKFFHNHLRKGTPALIKVLQQYKLLIVDEFQDLDESQFIFVKRFKELQPNLQIIAIGDLAQNIYRFRGTSNEFLRTLLQREVIPDIRSFNLTTNFRSSKAILRFVNFVFRPEIKDGHILPMEAPFNGNEGTKPKYFEFAVNPGKGMGEYEEKVANELIPVILRAKKECKSVVFIFPIIKCSSFQLITALLRQYSRKHEFAFDLHQIAKEDETSTTVAFGYNPRDPSSPIQFSSFHASKGLEWDIVAIINATDSMFELRDGEVESEAHYAEKTNLFYVGTTRAIEEMYIFANANMGGRIRLLARHGESLNKVLDITQWGTEEKEFEKGAKNPIGVKELLRRFTSHPDLNKRVQKCSENIVASGKSGWNILFEHVYKEMKMRNRELAFGTYIDWKLKQMLCSGKLKSFQDILIEILQSLKSINWKTNRHDSLEDISMRRAKLDVLFMNSNNEQSLVLDRFVSASRWLGMYQTKQFMCVPAVKEIYWKTERLLIETSKKKDKSVEDEYILSQSTDFYLRGNTQEIEAVTMPKNYYSGLPNGFEEFVALNQDGICDVVIDCLRSVGSGMGHLEGDIALETESLIIGEADMWTQECGGVLLEIKCGTAKEVADLRDTGNCKNLLQVLAYVAMGRHGVIPLKTRWAFLLNPLTAAWERYDLNSWSMEESREFMNCLEELRERG